MIKSIDKSEYGCCDHKTSRNTTAEMRKIFVWVWGGAGYLQMGRLRIKKKKEKWKSRLSAGRPYIHCFRRTNTVGESVANCDGESTRHCTDQLFQIPRWFRRYFLTVHLSRHAYGSDIQIRRWFRRYFWWWTGHVTRTVPGFESVGDSVGKFTRQNPHLRYPPLFH